MLAASNGNLEIVKVLIANGAKVDETSNAEKLRSCQGSLLLKPFSGLLI